MTSTRPDLPQPLLGMARKHVVAIDWRRKEVFGTENDFPTKPLAERELEARLSPIESLNYRGLHSASFKGFVNIWENNALHELEGVLAT
jgi:hypothetical protein